MSDPDADRYLKVGLHKLAYAPESDLSPADWFLASIALNVAALAGRQSHGIPRSETAGRHPWPFCRDCRGSHDPTTRCPEH